LTHSAFLLIVWIVILSGLAYKRNGNYEKAEELYVQSLHCAMTVAGGWQQWQLNDDDETNIIQSMTTNYDAWKEELRDGRSDRVDQNYAEKAFVPFLCLLSCAGFGTKATGKCKEFVDRLGKKSAKLILKAQYLSRTAAKKKLAEALSNADVSHFRSVLQDAVKPNCSMTIDTHDPGAKTRLQAKKSARREARDFVGTNFGFVSSKFFLCAMCDKSVAERRQCPCMTVTYCGRECQVAHWKAEHKNVCPNQKKKKQDPDKKHESTD
jgi:MYND finger